MTIYGNAKEGPRESRPVGKDYRKRRRCQCPAGADRSRRCGNKITHFGASNGVVLMAACAFHVAMWVRDGHIR